MILEIKRDRGMRIISKGYFTGLRPTNMAAYGGEEEGKREGRLKDGCSLDVSKKHGAVSSHGRWERKCFEERCQCSLCNSFRAIGRTSR